MILLDSRIYVFDNVFSDLNAVINEAKTHEFNRKDALYPGFDASKPVARWMEQSIVDCARKVMGTYFWFNTPSFRLALEGDSKLVNVPHTDCFPDIISPKFSFVIYLYDAMSEGERLGFFEHDSFGKFSLSEYDSAYQRKGTNDLSQWEEYASVPIKKNRGVMFSSSLFHMPTPGSGHGTTVDNGRLILPCFINAGWKASVHGSVNPELVEMK